MSVAAFQELLASRLGVPIASQELLSGFPPKSVQARLVHNIAFAFMHCCTTECQFHAHHQTKTSSVQNLIHFTSVQKTCFHKIQAMRCTISMCASVLLQMPAEASAVALSSLNLANGDTVVLRRLASSAAATASAALTTAPGSAPTASSEAAAASISTSVPEPQPTNLPYQSHPAPYQVSYICGCFSSLHCSNDGAEHTLTYRGCNGHATSCIRRESALSIVSWSDCM